MAVRFLRQLVVFPKSTLSERENDLFETAVITVYIVYRCQRIMAEHPVFDGKDCAGCISIFKKQ